MTYGGTLPALTASYSGFVNGDTAGSLTTLATLSTVTATSNVGSYTIGAGGAVESELLDQLRHGDADDRPGGVDAKRFKLDFPKKKVLYVLHENVHGLTAGTGQTTKFIIEKIDNVCKIYILVANGKNLILWKRNKIRQS